MSSSAEPAVSIGKTTRPGSSLRTVKLCLNSCHVRLNVFTRSPPGRVSGYGIEYGPVPRSGQSGNGYQKESAGWLRNRRAGFPRDLAAECFFENNIVLLQRFTQDLVKSHAGVRVGGAGGDHRDLGRYQTALVNDDVVEG